MCNSCERIFDESIELADNAMLKVRPELFYEWDFDKNDELGLDIYKVTKGSNKKVWWICTKCSSEWDDTINNRTYKKFNCPYCSGRRVNHTNSLASLNPELAKEWHPTKNGDLTPNDVTCNSNKKVWWLGKCGHEWEAYISNRNKWDKCPVCDGKQVLIGFNDMWTTNPELAKLLANSYDGYKYTEHSNKKVDWRCPDCGELIKNKIICNIYNRGLPCPNCSDGKSYPEKVMYHILKQLNVNFKWEKKFEWNKNRRYDFYLPDYNMIIEINGSQHYNTGFEKLGGRSIEQENKNDKLKEMIAKENGIENYIIIDAKYSDIEYIKHNVLKSKLKDYFDFRYLDWMKINKESLNSFVIKAIELWNNNHSIKEISNILKLSEVTIRKYMKKGDFSGICNYDGKKEIIKSVSQNGKKNAKECVQLSLNGDIIREWESISEASRYTNTFNNNISRCCKGKYKTAGGYKWMYKEDYDKLIHNQEVC